MSDHWNEGAGADEVPVLSHVFTEWSEFSTGGILSDGGPCKECHRCHEAIDPGHWDDRCPARLGQDRGFIQ